MVSGRYLLKKITGLVESSKVLINAHVSIFCTKMKKKGHTFL